MGNGHNYDSLAHDAIRFMETRNPDDGFTFMERTHSGVYAPIARRLNRALTEEDLTRMGLVGYDQPNGSETNSKGKVKCRFCNRWFRPRFWTFVSKESGDAIPDNDLNGAIKLMAGNLLEWQGTKTILVPCCNACIDSPERVRNPLIARFGIGRPITNPPDCRAVLAIGMRRLSATEEGLVILNEPLRTLTYIKVRALEKQAKAADAAEDAVVKLLFELSEIPVPSTPK